MSAEEPGENALRAAAAHGIRWSAISRPTVELVNLGSIVVLAHLVAPAEFGRFAIAVIAQEVAYVIGAGGLSNALVQRKTLDRDHLRTAMALGLIAGFALAVLTLIIASLIVAPVFGERTALFVRMIAPLCLIAPLNTVPIATLQRRMAFRRLSEIEIVGVIVRAGACIALALAGFGGEALVLGVIAGSATAALIAWASAPPPWPRLCPKPARELLRYAMPMSLASVSWVGFGNIDYAIVGARLGPLLTGYYYRAYTLAVEYQSKISVVMSQVGFPVLARTNTTTELGQLYRPMIRLLTVVVFPLLVLLAILAPTLVPFMFGARWSPAVAPTQILSLGGAATIIYSAVGTVFMSTGRTRTLLGFGWAQFIVYGIAIFVVAPLGLTAVAIAAALVHALFALISYVLMLAGSGEHPMRRLWSDVAPATVSCVALAAVAVPVSLALTAANVPAVLSIAAVGVVAVAPYLLTLRICFPATWRSQCAALELILPGHRRLSAVKRRLAAAAAVP